MVIWVVGVVKVVMVVGVVNGYYGYWGEIMLNILKKSILLYIMEIYKKEKNGF